MERKSEQMIDDYLKDMAIDEVVERVLRAVKRNDKRQEKDARDLRLRNTKMLLENYRLLKHHCESSLPIEKNAVYVFDGELEIESLMKYRRKTKRMLESVDEALAKYKQFCKGKESDERKYKIIKKMYVDEPGMNAEQLAIFFNVEPPRISSQKKIAINELSVLLFGIAAFEDLELLKG